MRSGLVILALLALVLAGPAPGEAAGGGRGGGGHGGGSHAGGGHGGGHWHGGWHHGHGCCWGGARFYAFPFAYGLPYPAYPYSAYEYPYPPYAQSVSVTPPASAYQPPPVQREVVYSHGKYVLYGDGVTQPWQWVWVPAAPPPPPAPAGSVN